MRGPVHLALTADLPRQCSIRALLDPVRRSAVDWSRVEAWWGDDRLVDGRTHSNVRVARNDPGTDHGLGLAPAVSIPSPS